MLETLAVQRDLEVLDALGMRLVRRESKDVGGQRQFFRHFAFSIVVSIDAVSYTHLDVYKRQGLQGSPDRRPAFH